MTDSVAPSSQKKARRMVPLRYVLTPILIILVAIFVLILMGIMAPKPAKKPVEIKAPLVEAVDLEKSDVAFTISSQGSVLPRTETTLISEVSGSIVSVSEKFQVGGFFKKGEEILRIDDIIYEVAFLKAESQLESAKAELEQENARGEQAKEEWLLTGKAIDKAPSLALRIPQLQQARANVKSAEANFKEAKTKLERTRILAPYDAMVKAKQVDIGQYVTTGSAMATTFAIDYAEVRLPVKQRDVEFLNLPKVNRVSDEASAVNIYYESNGQKHAWSSTLIRYEGVVDMSSRVHYVVAQLNDPYSVLEQKQSGELRVGTFVKADITGKTVNGLLSIPRDAVHGANTLYLIDNENKLHIQPIDIYRAEVDYVYTLDNVDSQFRLITTNLETPVEGMTLRVAGEEPVATADVEPKNDDQDDNS